MQEMVCGFLFSYDLAHVVLIRKEHPEWMKGMLNGVGGKVEPKENKWWAMIREFKEETGLHVADWKEFCVVRGINYRCYFYWTRGWNYQDVKTMTDEEVVIHRLDELHTLNLAPSLKWLIPMALDPGHYYSDCEHDK